MPVLIFEDDNIGYTIQAIHDTVFELDYKGEVHRVDITIDLWHGAYATIEDKNIIYFDLPSREWKGVDDKSYQEKLLRAVAYRVCCYIDYLEE